MLVRQPRMESKHRRTLILIPPLWYNGGCVAKARILWTQSHSSLCARWNSSYRNGTRRLRSKHVSMSNRMLLYKLS